MLNTVVVVVFAEKEVIFKFLSNISGESITVPDFSCSLGFSYSKKRV